MFPDDGLELGFGDSVETADRLNHRLRVEVTAQTLALVDDYPGRGLEAHRLPTAGNPSTMSPDARSYESSAFPRPNSTTTCFGRLGRNSPQDTQHRDELRASLVLSSKPNYGIYQSIKI